MLLDKPRKTWYSISCCEYRGIAQLGEQRSPKPRAGSSSLSTPAKKHRCRVRRWCFFVRRGKSNDRRAERERVSVRPPPGGGCREQREAQCSACGEPCKRRRQKPLSTRGRSLICRSTPAREKSTSQMRSAFFS